MHCVITAAVVVLVLVVLWCCREDFMAHKYPLAPYGFFRIVNVHGTPTGDFAGLDTGCSLRLDSMDQYNHRYKLTIMGSINKSLIFQTQALDDRKPGPHPPDSLFIKSSDSETAFYSWELKPNYFANTMAVLKDGAPAFTLELSD